MDRRGGGGMHAQPGMAYLRPGRGMRLLDPTVEPGTPEFGHGGEMRYCATAQTPKRHVSMASFPPLEYCVRKDLRKYD